MGDEIVIEKVIDHLKISIEKELGNSAIASGDNLIEKGLSSIQIMKISGLLRKRGVRIPFSDLMRNPTMEEWSHLIRNTPVKLSKKSMKEKAAADPHKEFPITDVQYAYFIGRGDDQILGGIGCHAYFEIDGADLSGERLNRSWNIIQNQNAMLRAKFNDNGTQQILETPYSKEIKVYDFRALAGNVLKEELLKLRSEISHRKLNIKEGQVAGLSLALLPDHKNRIYLDVDLLVADVMSISILIHQLSEVYSGETRPVISDYTFKDYIESKNADEQTADEDKAFWREKLSFFPKESPDLPLKKKPELIEKVLFTRRKRTLDSERWNQIKIKAAKYKVTPSMVLFTCYSMVIERWVNQDCFVMNMPLFNRDIENEYVNHMIADFTNLLLIECERKNDETVLGKMKRLSETFLENAAHSSYSGVKVLRDIHKEAGENANIAPLVFACNIDYPLETEKTKSVLGNVSYMISQTPQVWLDFQVYVKDGELLMCWDAVDEMYYEEMLDDMMDSICRLLKFLSDHDDWDMQAELLTDRQMKVRKNDLERILPLEFPDKTLISGFADRVRSHPANTAMIDPETDMRFTYKELYDISFALSRKLIKNGITKNSYVGLTLPRGYHQIIGLLAILFAGAAYVSIGINQPKERRSKIYQQIGIRYVLTDQDTMREISLDEDEVQFITMDCTGEAAAGSPVEINPFDTAYVIMTSGTTGVPKGVEIAHNSAVNTILELNERYHVSDEDNIILVSSIDFDLSVYDIFGLLSAGGTLITLNDSNFKDPDLWLDLINKYHVTIWNSVPILFDMLITMAEGKAVFLPLRLVFLSGDWISITLPERFYQRSGEALAVGMGGATEASIWSNYIDIPRSIPEDWKTIPYGKALKNQVYRVADDLGRICPNYVAGELLIGGVGVAKGYRGDKELTDSKFIQIDGMRWYKTGDTGRIWNDGTIEFLGRKDSQVKIRGHRIELGEIEAAILKNPFVKNAVVETIELAGNNQIIVFAEPKKEFDENLPDVNLQLKEEIHRTKEGFEDYDTYLSEQNKSVVRFLFDIFKELGVFTENRGYSLDEILETTEIGHEYKALFVSWLCILEKNGMIKRAGENDFLLLSGAAANGASEMAECIPHQELLKSEILKILSGNKSPVDVFYDPKNGLSPVEFLRNMKNYDQNARRIGNIVKLLRKKRGKNLKILEFAGRDKNFTELLLKTSEDQISAYVYCDNTLYFKDEFREIGSRYDNFKYQAVELESGLPNEWNGFDLIIFNNSIHRFPDIVVSLKVLKSVMEEGGFILGTEIHSGSLLSNVTAGVLEKGFDKYELDKRDGSIIPNSRTMERIFEACGILSLYLSEDSEVEETGKLLFAGQKPESLFSLEELKADLKERLPEYMIPHNIIKIEELPLNKNGKVDRKKLKKLYDNLDCDNGRNDEITVRADTETTSFLMEIWKKLLEKESIKAASNYFHVGGDSLMATKLISEVKETFGVVISVGDVFANPILADLSDFIDAKKGNAQAEFKKSIETDLENLNEPFHLTDVQFAYWIGRSGAYSLSSVSTHCYYELDCTDVNAAKLQKVMNGMIRDHAMLRAVILKNGKQQILKETPPYVLEINNVSYFEEHEKESILMEIRKEMSHEVINTEKWPLFHFRASIIEERKLRLHIGFDNLILDGWSMFQLLKEIRQRYDNEGFEFEKTAVSFRDYVLALNKMKETPKYLEDKNYWINRLDHFLNPPEFEHTKPENQVKNQIFTRREKTIPADRWLKLKKLAQENEITPTIMLITLFSEALLKFSVNEEFVLNITQFNREQIHPDINKIVGDFTTLTFLEVKKSEDHAFIIRAKRLQKQLSEDIDHRLYSAIEFGRELRLNRGNEQESLMPIVFTSGLGLNSQHSGNWIGDIAYSISQTPQVWLDHQVTEENGELNLVWDSVDEIFPLRLLDDMFDYYSGLVENLADGKMTVSDDFSKLAVTEKEAYFSGNINPEAEVGNLEKSENRPVTEMGEHRYLYDGIMGIWAKILGTRDIDCHKNFIELGGNSLNIIQMSNAILDKYGYEIDIIEFMSNPTIENLAGRIAGNSIKQR